MQHRVPASLTELNNVFLVAIKNQPLTDQINFEKVELFEVIIIPLPSYLSSDGGT